MLRQASPREVPLDNEEPVKEPEVPDSGCHVDQLTRLWFVMIWLPLARPFTRRGFGRFCGQVSFLAASLIVVTLGPRLLLLLSVIGFNMRKVF